MARNRREDERHGPSRLGVWSVVGALLAVHAGLAITSNLDSSATVDEPAHLVAGYSYLATGDFRLVPEHPPLAQMWAALPLLLSDPVFPARNQPDWWYSAAAPLGVELIYGLGNDSEMLLTLGRSMVVVLSVVLGLVVFMWSARLFGTRGGLVSLALYAFSPTMLAHGALITTDLASALFFLLASGALWSVLQRVTLWRVLLSGLAVAALVLSKFSGLLILPIAGVMVVVRLILQRPIVIGRGIEVRNRAGRLGVVAVLFVAHVAVVSLAVWAAYGFRYGAFEEHVAGRDRLATFGLVSPYESSWDFELRRTGRLGGVVELARDYRLLPESFLYGLLYAIDSTGARRAFLAGESTSRGFVWFFPYAFLIKTPLPLFGVLMAAAVVAWGRFRRGTEQQRQGGHVAEDGRGDRPVCHSTAPLWILLAVYWLFALKSHINIGHRHLLAVYPALFILCGASADLLVAGKRAVRLVVPFAVGLLAMASVVSWPHYLGYFNHLIGKKTNAYRHLVDSSLDWGQDLGRLADWLEDYRSAPTSEDGTSTGDGDTVYIARFGSTPLSHYGIEAKVLAAPPQTDEPDLLPLGEGLYCISASMLQQVSLLPTSRWTPALESAYRSCLPVIRQVNDPSSAKSEDDGPGGCIPDENMVLTLRFGRLCAFLRQREPDAQIGGSILIYRLTDSQIEEALFGPVPESVEDDAQAMGSFAGQMMRAGCDRFAMRLWEKVLAIDGGDANTHIQLGRALLGRGRFEEANAHFDEALKCDRSLPLAHYGRGLCLARGGRSDEALSSYRAALRLDPRAADIWSDYSLALASVGRADEAIAALDEALHLRPRDPFLRCLRGELLARTGRWEAALSDVAASLAEEPDSARAHALMGSILAAKGNIEQARAHYREAVGLRPRDVLLRAEFALMLSSAGLVNEALGEYELMGEVGVMDPVPAWWPRVLLDWGLTLAQAGHSEESTARFREAVALDPQLADVLAEHGVVLGERVDSARGSHLPEAEGEEDDAPALVRRADRLAAVGRPREAVVLYEKAISLDPDDPMLRYRVAMLRTDLGQYADALADCVRATELAPEFAEAHLQLGILHGLLDDPESAIMQYQETIKIQPSMMAAHYNLGTVLAHVGRFKEAVGAMEQALNLAIASQRGDLETRIRARLQEYTVLMGEQVKDAEDE